MEAVRLQLAARRRELGISQQELAARMHISRQTLSDLERRRGNDIQLGVLIRWVEALGDDIAVTITSWKPRRQ